MSFALSHIKNHVIGARDEICTADYGTRQPDYPTHKGIDLISKSGNRDIVAIADGVVVTVQDGVTGYDDSVFTAGNFVKIKHANGYCTRYLHLVTNSICIKNGAHIRAGEKIGIMGNTGYSLGMHLHFDVNNGKSYIDPLPYLTGAKNFENNTKADITEIACAVIRGEYGNGEEREERLTALGYDYNAVQSKVNEILNTSTPKKPTKNIDEIACAVIRGEYGNGEEREERLTALGYDYNAVQARVNEILKRG